MISTKQFLTLKEASQWASNFLRRDISESNISYLVQYGKVKKHNGGSAVFVKADDLKNYYDSYRGKREINWKRRLGDDLNWALSFEHLREKDTTKHVHRLHPYKGKFIPQLVEYFIDGHTDDFKTSTYFNSSFAVSVMILGHKKTLQVDKFCMRQNPVDKEGHETDKTYNDASRGSLEFQTSFYSAQF